MTPRATYRLQFNRDFPFAAAAELADYFRDLEVSHIYASPILTARAGSMHGYDVVDHAHVNPELGGEEGLLALATALRSRNLGLVVDIVPNHVAVGHADNAWWQDLLRNGPASRYADYFDIDWDMPGLEGKLFAPFLGESPEQASEKGDLRLVRDASGEAVFSYFEHRFPLRPEDQHLDIAALSGEQRTALLHRQHFILGDWREANQKINWRRFFDITQLAAIRVLNPDVFEATHAKLLSLFAQGAIDGFRVDHIDGISDPQAYCRMLRQRMERLRPGGYLVVEKILARSERLPQSWGADGTTGYDFMNDVSALLHRPDGGRMEMLWQREGARDRDFDTEESQARHEILTTRFASQLDATARAFQRLLPDDDLPGIRSAIAAVIGAMRYYRGYATGGADSPGPDRLLLAAFERARRDNPFLAGTMLLLERQFGRTDADPSAMDALRRFWQLSAPVAAKAVEDTAFYRYGRLLSRNDVGFDPRQHYLRIEDFHARMQEQARRAPAAMLAVSTHDHKRGADVRAHLAALPGHAEIWDRLVQSAPRPDAIHPGDAYHLYQTLLGAWPARGFSKEFADRIGAWCVKYLREAKLRSSWGSPDLAYEKAFCAFGRDLLSRPDWSFWRDAFAGLVQMLEPQATRNTIAQTVLHLTCPGVPDIYQGCEFGDFSLVDPDNRRAVDYPRRMEALASGTSPKQKIIARLLHARRTHPDLWARGSYHPLTLSAKGDIVAFYRTHERSKLIVVCRLTDVELDPAHMIPLERDGTELLTERSFGAGPYSLSSLLGDLPAAVLLI